MATHHDDDAGNPEINAALRAVFGEKAHAMTDAGLNRITAGEPGEKAMYAEEVDGITVRRMPHDPLALRISIGSPRDLDEGAYCVFRGKPSETIELLERALAAMRKAHKAELDVEKRLSGGAHVSLRIRNDGRILCAAMHPEEQGDVYLPDSVSYRLTVEYRVIVTEPMHSTEGRGGHAKHGEWWWRDEVPSDAVLETEERTS